MLPWILNCGGGGLAGKLSAETLKKAKEVALTKPCKDFLETLIKGLGNKLAAGFSIDKLIEDFSKADIQSVRSLGGPGRYEHVEGNTIQMAGAAYGNHYYNYGTGTLTTIPGDEFSVYLHATFHLQMSSSSGTTNLTDVDLYDAIPQKPADRHQLGRVQECIAKRHRPLVNH